MLLKHKYGHDKLDVMLLHENDLGARASVKRSIWFLQLHAPCLRYDPMSAFLT